MPKVVIIILNWNRLHDTLECIASVLRLTYPNYEVVVVDNGSSDNSVVVIRRMYPGLVVIENKENLGYTGGNNIGLRYAMRHDADYVWLVNNDTMVEPDTLGRLVAQGERSRSIGLISPVVCYYDTPGKRQFVACYIDWEAKTAVYTKEPEQAIAWQEREPDRVALVGTALLIKRCVIEDVGYLDDRFYMYCEDIDYSIRASRSGYRNVVATEVSILHKNMSYEDREHILSPAFYYYNVRNEYLLWTKYLTHWKKLLFMRQYLAYALREVEFCIRHSLPEECAEACLDGAWHALRGDQGAWDRARHIPRVLKKLQLGHPNLATRLLQVDLSAICSHVWRGMKRKFQRTVQV